ncbi:MAG: hypothetical protein Q8N96_03085 [Methylovulum sp.]|nr:hypothetical protein [Methylovulum sp.]
MIFWILKTRPNSRSSPRMALLGIIPKNTSGLGNPVQTLQIYHEIGALPLRQVFLELNGGGKAVVGFSEPDWKLLSA